MIQDNSSRNLKAAVSHNGSTAKNSPLALTYLDTGEETTEDQKTEPKLKGSNVPRGSRPRGNRAVAIRLVYNRC